jgi:hypothetical protein
MEIINDPLFLLVLVFLAGSLYIQVRMQRAMDKIEKDLRSSVDKMIRDIKVERVGDLCYWFDKENDQFIAQGKTIDEIATVLKQRFPKKIFLAENQIWAGPDFHPLDTTEWLKVINGKHKENTQ